MWDNSIGVTPFTKAIPHITSPNSTTNWRPYFQISELLEDIFLLKPPHKEVSLLSHSDQLNQPL